MQRKYPIGLQSFRAIRISEHALADFNTDNPEPAPLLFQTGYLTIKETKGTGQVFVLGYPNREVKESLTTHGRK